MKLKNERTEMVYKYDTDCSPEEEARIRKIAIERFALDPKAQLEYGVLTILSDTVSAMEESELGEPLVKKIKGDKDGNQNNSGK